MQPMPRHEARKGVTARKASTSASIFSVRVRGGAPAVELLDGTLLGGASKSSHKRTESPPRATAFQSSASTSRTWDVYGVVKRLQSPFITFMIWAPGFLVDAPASFPDGSP